MDHVEDADKIRLTALWHNRLQEAELKLRLAQEHLHDAIANLNPRDGEEGLSAFRQVSQAELEALREYERILRIFCDLVEHDKVPDERGGDQE